MRDKSTALQVVRRASVVDEIIESFRLALMQGELAPGQRLPSESDLTQQMGVGRTALREAMKKLEALGVVRIQRGDGTYIADEPSPDLLNPIVFALLLEAGTGNDLIELRWLLEIGYCQLAAQKATPEDWQDIERAAQAWESYTRQPQGDADQLAQLDLDFHFAILDATHNPLLIRVGRTVEQLFMASIRSTLLKAKGLETGRTGHRRILQALRSGESGTIQQAVTDSLIYWGQEISTTAEATQSLGTAGGNAR